ncbi:MoxR family ATPase [Thalassobacillus sp. CUG 92003]|uniref:AAA family ATPase n=1 Tax=Thalassobacillus sp. CUG 92003 TaxID=2736641 RepID=UPI0015E74D83|nr:MoxR family ATPase [Thalassobacillus sp. CUG 92003]
MQAMLHNIQRAQEALKKVIIGQDEVIHLLFIALLANGHVLFESVPGSGKTKLAKSFAHVISGKFSRVQFTPDVLPGDVTGIQFFNPKRQEFELRMGPAVTNFLLADEINRATPKTQSSLLEVMEERQITINGETITLPAPFIVMATQNPVEHNQGTFPLPEAQLDRFLFKIKLDYPGKRHEKEILSSYQSHDPLLDLPSLLTSYEIVTLQEEVKDVTVAEPLKDYLIDLAHTSREHPEVEVGVSTRAALALMRAAQASAVLKERSYVTPQDIKELAHYVFEHRLILSMEGSIRKTNEDVTAEIIQDVEVPVELGSYGQ